MRIKWNDLLTGEDLQGRILSFVQTPDGTKALVIKDGGRHLETKKLTEFDVVPPSIW